MFEDLEEKLHKDPELKKHHQQEKLILDVTELIAKQMEKNKINKTKLAGLLGVGSSHITQLLDGTRNMTLRTIADVFTALDAELVINTASLSLELSQTCEYEADDLMQTTIDTLPKELLPKNWMPNDSRERLVA